MIEYNSQEKQDSLSHVRFADEELIKTQVLQGEAAQTIIQGKNCSVYKMENETGEGVITRYPVFPGIELLYCDIFGCENSGVCMATWLDVGEHFRTDDER